MVSLPNLSLSWLCHSDLEPLFWRAERRGPESAWWGHVPFAHWIVCVTRPRLLVELGTENGVSYSAFCHAVERMALNTRCFAVDSWEGDEHTGQYGQDVYDALLSFHDERYASFSTLLRCRFDDALDRFEDGSIDLLHIDGLHTYEAVRHDFETWLPKLSDHAVVLFHDISEYRGDFGVWRFWQEVSGRYPAFEFVHGHGLGLLAVGSAPATAVSELCRLGDPGQIAVLRSRVALIGDRWDAEMRERSLYRRSAEQATRAAALERQLEEQAGRLEQQAQEHAAHTAALQRQSEEQARQIRRLQAQLDETTARAIIADRGGRAVTEIVEVRRDWVDPKLVLESNQLRFRRKRGRIAIVIHVYYVDLWPELSDAVSNIKEPFDLFVTLVTGQADTLAQEITEAWPFAYILVVENRGRDILPFISIVRTGILFRYQLVCKLHTKRSLWHEDGEAWRKNLIDGVLATPSLVCSILRAFRTEPSLGMVVADGQMYSAPELWEGNRTHLVRFFAHLGMDENEFGKAFAGGSIFWIRPSLLRLISDLPFRSDEFEPEPLGKDGCLAHAIERLISLACYEGGMTIKETGMIMRQAVVEGIAGG